MARTKELTSIGLTRKETRALAILAAKALRSFDDVKYYTNPVIRALEVLTDVSSELVDKMDSRSK